MALGRMAAMACRDLATLNLARGWTSDYVPRRIESRCGNQIPLAMRSDRLGIRFPFLGEEREIGNQIPLLGSREIGNQIPLLGE